MAVVFCPACSDLVERDDHLCSRCGSDLFATYSERSEPGSTPPALDFQPGASFAERFTIIEKIGAGGMGMVYKAIDTMLDAEVALKLIRPGLAELPGFIERFRREVRVTRQMTHPNICRFHDIGESGHILYVSMQWIEGETLHQLLEQTGMLREGRALEIAEKISLALEAAHAENIIHRDLKPSNVMIDRRGGVYVLDFGLALERGGDDLTDGGILLGTPAYMAPEQRRLRRLDPRVDLYALGLILREMLVGMRLEPEPGLTPALRSALNPVVLPVLEGLLAEDPADRCPSAKRATAMIREVLGCSEISAATGPRDAPAPRRVPPWLWLGSAAAVVVAAAVLGVTFLRGPPEGMNPEAAIWYKRGNYYLREQGESVRGIDDAIQMFNRALDRDPESPRILAGLGEAFWTRYRETRADVARREAIGYVDRAYAIAPGLPEVLTARAAGFIEEGRFRAAGSDLEAALAADPDHSPAWARLGVVHTELGEYVEGLAAFDRALELSPSSFGMHIHLGRFHERFGEYDKSAEYYRSATELKPDSPIAWNNLGAALLYTGRVHNAIPALERSLQIEDRASTRSNLGTALYFLGRYEESVAHYRVAVELEPNDAVHWGNLGDGLLAAGDEAGAIAAYSDAATRARERALRETLNPDAQQDLALYCAKARDYACALDAGAAAAELQPENPSVLLVNAVIRCQLGRDEESLEWLERAISLGASRAQIEASPEFGRLADDPRFRALLELAS